MGVTTRRVHQAFVSLLLALTQPAVAQGNAVDTREAGMIKTVSGNVTIKRGAESLQALPGMLVYSQDIVQTAERSAVGIMLRDHAMLSAGPASELRIDKFNFDTRTQTGEMETTLKRGSLAGVSGAIAKYAPESVRFKTSSLTLGVRGTKFIIEAADQED